MRDTRPDRPPCGDRRFPETPRAPDAVAGTRGSRRKKCQVVTGPFLPSGTEKLEQVRTRLRGDARAAAAPPNRLAGARGRGRAQNLRTQRLCTPVAGRAPDQPAGSAAAAGALRCYGYGSPPPSQRIKEPKEPRLPRLGATAPRGDCSSGRLHLGATARARAAGSVPAPATPSPRPAGCSLSTRRRGTKTPGRVPGTDPKRPHVCLRSRRPRLFIAASR